MPGDDVRRIDWNATARTGEPHVRVDVAERALTTWLLLDASASMTFGTADRRKWDVAEGVALVLGQLASRRGNRLGLVTYGEPRGRLVPPRQGRAGLLATLHALREEPAHEGGGQTSPAESLQRVGALARGRSLVVMVGDLRGARDWRGPLLQLAARHEVIAVEIRDPREQELPDVGHLAPRRPGDRPPDPRRHAQPQAPRSASPRRPPPSARRSRPTCAGSACGTSSCPRPATGCAASAAGMRQALAAGVRR